MNNITLSRPLPADQSPAAVYLARLGSAGSRRVMSTALNNIAFIFGVSMENLDWTALRYQHTQFARAQLMQAYAPSTVNRHLSALRGVLKEAWRLGFMDAEEYQRAVDITSIKEDKLPAGRYVKRDEIRALLATCRDDGVIGIRDLALVALLCATGMRRSEVVSLQIADYTADEKRLEITQGKGRKGRIVFLDDATHSVLSRWLLLRGARDGALFTSTDKHMAALSPNAVYMMLKRRIKKADIADLSPHDLRRTFVSDMLENGVDIATVAKIVGHEQVETTRRYDRRGEETLQNAAEHINLPLDDL